MAQHDYNLANQSGADFRADLNNALSAIVTVNSGATAPSTTFAHQLWVDTSSNVLKIRNAANDAWVTTGVSITADNTFDINGGTVNGITALSFSTGASVTSILDEDNLGSDSATALATQQSIKAYVDSQIGSVDTLAEILLNGNTTGGTDIAFGDNDKATFGNSDLEIYHDGSHSYIDDAGVGDLVLRGNNQVLIRDKATNDVMVNCRSGQFVKLYYNNAEKLATTSTGIDVTGEVESDTAHFGTGTGTGTIIADEVVVSGTGSTGITIHSPDANNATLVFGSTTDNDYAYIQGYYNSGSPFIRTSISGSEVTKVTSSGLDVTGTVTSDGLTVDGADVFFNSGWIKSNSSLRIDIDNDNNQTDRAFFISHGNASKDIFKASENGDISFYDDTGTTKSFFWDASAERLGLGTTSPDAPLHISAATEPYIRIENTDTILTEGQVVGGLAFEQNDSTGGGTGITGRIQMRSADRPDNGSYFGNVADMDFLVSGASTGLASDNATKTAMTIRAGTGSVGIGTDSPSAALNIVNSGLVTQFRVSNTVSDATTKYGAIVGSHYTNAEEPITGMLMTSSSSSTGGTVSIGGGISSANAVNNILFYTAANNTTLTGSEAGRFDSSGNFLVSTTNTAPATNNVAGIVLRNEGHINVSRASGVVGYFNRITNDGEIIRFNKDGSSVGSIGTVAGGFTIGRGDTGLFFDSDFDNIRPFDLTAGSSLDATIDLGRSATRFKDLHLSNQVYINGTSPNIRFTDSDTGADSQVSASSGYGALVLKADYNNETANSFIGFEVDGSEAGRFDASGNFLVGKTTTATANVGIELRNDGLLAVTRDTATVAIMNRNTNGTIIDFRKSDTSVGSISTAGGTTSYNTTSDARLKDVTGEARGLEVITKLNPVAYNWKADGKADEGLIAQEVKELVPNAVTGSEDEHYQMDYSKLVTHLVKGMKEQQEQIESLKSEIANLKGEI